MKYNHLVLWPLTLLVACGAFANPTLPAKLLPSLLKISEGRALVSRALGGMTASEIANNTARAQIALEGFMKGQSQEVAAQIIRASRAIENGFQGEGSHILAGITVHIRWEREESHAYHKQGLLRRMLPFHSVDVLVDDMTMQILAIGPRTTYGAELQNAHMLPRGSALMTSSGNLAERGIVKIIHAATGGMSRGGGFYEPTLKSIQDSIRNSLILANFNNYPSIAIPFIGGNIFLGRIGVTAEELAQSIIQTAIKNRGSLQLRLVAYGERDTTLFEKVLTELYPDYNADDISVVSGSITDFQLHGAPVIVNAANMEVVFGGGLSGAIASATGQADSIDAEARQVITEFHSIEPAFTVREGTREP